MPVGAFDLIGHDTDACDCLLNTLGTLAERATCRPDAVRRQLLSPTLSLLEPQQCRARLHAALPKLKACLSLLAWQLATDQPHTAIEPRPQEQLALLKEAGTAFSGSCTQNRPRQPPTRRPCTRPGHMKLHN